ncbi:MAG: TVP38/TMEM64 family protein [Chthoniobacterales bacterium]
MKRRALSIHYALLAIAALFVGWLAWKFPILSWIQTAQRWVQSLGPASIVAYPLLYAGCNVLLLPAGVLVVGAGFFFGLWVGCAVVLLGNILGAAIAFVIARTVARKWVERKMLANARWQAMDEVIGEKGGRIVFLSQLHPLFPTSLLNYFYGITRLPFWSCLGWVALGQLPGIFLYVYLGTIGQYGVQILQEKSRFQLGESGLWIAGLLAALGISIALARLSMNLLKEIDERAVALQVG